MTLRKILAQFILHISYCALAYSGTVVYSVQVL
jgi:hypothetical protein